VQQKTGLTLSDSDSDGVSIVRVGGYLDGHTIMSLERHIDLMCRSGRKRLVLELSGLAYIASAGVGLFINLSHRLSGQGGRLELVSPSDSVKEIFTILGLDTILTIHPTLEDGVAAAGG
jgi:anti-sigma B factor antagonist